MSNFEGMNYNTGQSNNRPTKTQSEGNVPPSGQGHGQGQGQDQGTGIPQFSRSTRNISYGGHQHQFQPNVNHFHRYNGPTANLFITAPGSYDIHFSEERTAERNHQNCQNHGQNPDLSALLLSPTPMRPAPSNADKQKQDGSSSFP